MNENSILFKEIWDKEIIKKFKLAKPNQQRPILGYVLGGQPGVGKSYLTENIRQELKNDIIEINGDVFRKYHPNFKEFQNKFGQDSPKYTASFAGEVTEYILDRAIKEKYNLIIEGTFRTVETPIKTLELLKKNGYQTNVHVKIHNHKDSWQSCLERYEKMKISNPKEARYTDKEHHDLVVKNLAQNINEISKSNYVDNLKIFAREKEIYNSKDGKLFKISIVNKELGIIIRPFKGKSKDNCISIKR